MVTPSSGPYAPRERPPDGPAPELAAVLAWLLESAPSIRWRVLRDVVGALPAEVAAERARVTTEGKGARLLTLQALDGTWGGSAWKHGLDSILHVLMLVRNLGLDPANPEAARAVGPVRDRVAWMGCGPPDCAANPFFAGEVEPCINGQVAAVGTYFAQDAWVLVERLAREQLADGDTAPLSTHGSFHCTISVLEALLAYEQHEQEVGIGRRSEVMLAWLRGTAYLLERWLRRGRSTGEMIERNRKDGADWTRFAFPTWWHFDVQWALDYLRRGDDVDDGARAANARTAEAVSFVEEQGVPVAVGRRSPPREALSRTAALQGRLLACVEAFRGSKGGTNERAARSPRPGCAATVSERCRRTAL